MPRELPPQIRERAMRLAQQELAEEPDERDRFRRGREELLAEYGFRSRIREDDDRVVLVCYPAEWVADGTIDRHAIEDLDRAIELPLSGADDPASWGKLAADNRELAESVGDEYGPVHGANAAAFSAFMNNHRGRPIGTASDNDVEEFLAEYYPRNVWPSEEERAVVEESVELVLEVAEERDD